MEIVISKESFFGIVRELIESFRVYGPVVEGDYHKFALLTSGDELDLRYQNSRLSPKELLHPHSERMFTYSLKRDDPEAGILKEAPKDFSPRVILGIRPCDARAFQLDDRNFVTATYKDPWWAKRREATTLIGLACNEPCSTCFCTTVESGPFDARGVDVLLIDIGQSYVVKAVTEKGRSLVSGFQVGEEASHEVAQKVDSLQKSAERRMGVQFNVDAIKRQNMIELFEASFWEDVQFACINCGTCTFLCPTCWCFDIQDEVYKDEGDRIRIWDSCMFPLFTLHGSGHNPRARKLQRVRQRFMHKLKYYPEKYSDGVACVGCGRCVQFCSVNIDIRQVARFMSESCICPV